MHNIRVVALGLVVWVGAVLPGWAFEKLPEDSVLRNTAGVEDRDTAAAKDYGVLDETPNQRRARLGEQIAESHPPTESDFGEKLETPNDRLRRLGRPTPWEAAQGVAQETPNQVRARHEGSLLTSSLPE